MGVRKVRATLSSVVVNVVAVALKVKDCSVSPLWNSTLAGTPE